MTLEISCAFATSLRTPGHVALAERLGYRRAWLYDSPALYPDVWVALADCARATSRIGLGPGVLVPSLRHPMVNAAAIAQLTQLAPGRITIGIGTGFTGRLTLGQRPLKWDFVCDYVRCVRTLLKGESVEWDGATIRMLHPPGFAPARPIEVPFLFGASGPKGNDAARALDAGVFATPYALPPAGMFRWVALLTFGTVLGEGEDAGSGRVVDAAGHGAAVALHRMYERKRDLTPFPGAEEWVKRIESVPQSERHLKLHELHLIGVNERDRPLMTPELLRMLAGVRTKEEWRAYLADMESKGITEVAYQPAGPDIEGELARFAAITGTNKTSA